MKVKELIALLEKFDGNMKIMMISGADCDSAADIGKCKMFTENEPDNDLTEDVVCIMTGYTGCYIKEK